MAKYKVFAESHHIDYVAFEIEASSPEEAAELVDQGQGTKVDESQDERTDFEVRTVEDANGNTVLTL